MLFGIPSLLGPEFLSVLRAMGHGDEIALVDGNYPAAEHGRRLVRADGHDVISVLDAVLSLMPIDEFVDEAMFRAVPAADPKRIDPVHADMIAICAKRVPGKSLIGLAGADFYPRVKSAYAVVATSEMRLHGNIILRKGIIRPS
jgi:L-fucose mutarotase